MSANERQIGGTHYQQSSYQHWDWVVDVGIGYLEGNATKYISRWRRKGGLADLEKALHYVDKLIERLPDIDRWEEVDREYLEEMAEKFCVLNRLSETEARICTMLGTWQAARPGDTDKHLRQAREELLAFIVKVAEPVPLEDSNRHAERRILD